MSMFLKTYRTIRKGYLTQFHWHLYFAAEQLLRNRKKSTAAIDRKILWSLQAVFFIFIWGARAPPFPLAYVSGFVFKLYRKELHWKKMILAGYVKNTG